MHAWGRLVKNNMRRATITRCQLVELAPNLARSRALGDRFCKLCPRAAPKPTSLKLLSDIDFAFESLQLETERRNCLAIALAEARLLADVRKRHRSPPRNREREVQTEICPVETIAHNLTSPGTIRTVSWSDQPEWLGG